MQIVGYARVSTDNQDGSIPAQIALIETFAQGSGHQLLAVYQDKGESGSWNERPGLREAISALREPSPAALVVAKLDRLTRSVLLLEELRELYFGRDRPFTLLCTSYPIDLKTPGGVMIARIYVAFSAFELETNHERTETVLSHKKSQGHRTGGIPYGFDVDSDSAPNDKGRRTKLIPNTYEQSVIAIIGAMSAEGKSPRAIARDLTDLAVPTKSGAPSWAHSTVAGILERAKITVENTD